MNVHLVNHVTDPVSDNRAHADTPTPSTEAMIHAESAEKLLPAGAAESAPATPSGNTGTRQSESPVTPLLAESLPPNAPGPSRLTPTVYFRADELSTPPRIKDTPAFDPETIAGELKKKGGAVVVRIFISAGGHIDEIVVLEKSLSDKATEHITKTFEMTSFEPGLLGKKAVNSQIDYEINLEALGPSRSRSSDSITR